jgi:hypothetical protein
MPADPAAPSVPPDLRGLVDALLSHERPQELELVWENGRIDTAEYLRRCDVYADARAALDAALAALVRRVEEPPARFHAGHAIALHMVIEMAKECPMTGDELADRNMRNALVRAREVQQWLEPLAGRTPAPSREDRTNGE